MAKADKTKILNRPRVDDGKVDVPGVGEFRIRQLSREEALRIHALQEKEGDGPAEALLLHLGCVDPAWTLEEAAQWQAEPGSSLEIQPVSQAIGTISGMMAGSGKDAYKSAGR